MQLHPHSSAPGSPIEQIDVTLVRPSVDVLDLRFELVGAVVDLAIPTQQPPQRTDGLWQHTCFEAFVAAAHGYYEFNFAPSSQWAAYRFSGYREGMTPAEIAPPVIRWSADAGTARLDVRVQLPPDATGPLGLSAVIEARDGGKSWWALAHPAARPDFHAAACFVAELPPAG